MDHISAVADNVQALSSVFRSPHCRVELRSGYSLPAWHSAIGPLPLSFRPTPGNAPGCSAQPGVFGVDSRPIS
eukprot:16445337-Heterocapsa_arctica.AAC.1